MWMNVSGNADAYIYNVCEFLCDSRVFRPWESLPAHLRYIGSIGYGPMAPEESA